MNYECKEMSLYHHNLLELFFANDRYNSFSEYFFSPKKSKKLAKEKNYLKQF